MEQAIAENHITQNSRYSAEILDVLRSIILGLFRKSLAFTYKHQTLSHLARAGRAYQISFPAGHLSDMAMGQVTSAFFYRREIERCVVIGIVETHINVGLVGGGRSAPISRCHESKWYSDMIVDGRGSC